MAAIDPVELGKWQRCETDPSRFRRLICGFWHTAGPKLMDVTFSPMWLALGSVRALSMLSVTLIPVWVKFYDHTATLTWTEAVIYSAVISVPLTFNFYYDKLIRGRKGRATEERLKRRLALEACGVTHDLSNLVKMQKVEKRPDIDAACAKVLECVRDAARIHVKDFEGSHLEATLLLFDDHGGERMRIAFRTTKSRPVGRVVPSAEVMAFYVAKSQRHRIVYDFKRDNHPFPKQGLSKPDPAYRSIFLIPLLDVSSGAPDNCVGVVTLDSARAYHFWPGSGEPLVVFLQPYLSQLTFLLNLTDRPKLSCGAKTGSEVGR